jgi:hypothetical protein
MEDALATAFIPISFISGLVIISLFSLPNGIWCLRLAKRKGKSKHYFWLGLIPFFGGIWVVWMSSLTDKSVLDELKRLRNAVNALQK